MGNHLRTVPRTMTMTIREEHAVGGIPHHHPLTQVIHDLIYELYKSTR